MKTLVEKFDKLINETPVDQTKSERIIDEWLERVSDFRETLAHIDYTYYLMENP